MGLAASQARFLGITMRKANCEFQTTQLAEQKLQLSNQLSHIAQEYQNSFNATKLMWCNEACTGDYQLSYSLLMMPSAANDYNPFFVSTKSGALVLNSRYAEAAKAAGIGVGGAIPSEVGRNAFIEALSAKKGTTITTGFTTSTGYTIQTDVELATKETTDRILNGVSSGGTQYVKPTPWNPSAGLGATPEDKSVMNIVTIHDLVTSKSIGGRTLDWMQMFLKEGQYSEVEKDEKMQAYIEDITAAKNYLHSHNTSYPDTVGALTTIRESIETATISINSHSFDAASFVKSVQNEIFKSQETSAYVSPYTSVIDTFNSAFKDTAGYDNDIMAIFKEFARLEFKIGTAANSTARDKYSQQLLNLKQGLNPDGDEYKHPEAYGVIFAYYNYYKNLPEGTMVAWDSSTNITNMAAYMSRSALWGTSGHGSGRGYDTTPVISGTGSTATIDMTDLFQTEKREFEWYSDGNYTGASSGQTDGYQFTVMSNGVIDYNDTSLRNMTISDLLTEDIILVTRSDSWKDGDCVEELSYRAEKLMDYIAEVFGCGHIGQGLNVDEAADDALTMALYMVKKKFLKAGNAIYSDNPNADSSGGVNDDVIKNANSYNRIGSRPDKNIAAVNLTNMVSAFLTYFDNYLRGTDSDYTVGKSNDESEDSKTFFVTDDPTYKFILNPQNGVNQDERIADFYDELYNNLCMHGWRLDDTVDHSEYLEHQIKDGRYQLMSLNNDGYFYQTRYNDTGYLEEVTDSDAITRAEAEYAQKKAEITHKEDLIDIKTKKLDAEIAELTTEITSVQNIITKSIEKTFQMFSS